MVCRFLSFPTCLFQVVDIWQTIADFLETKNISKSGKDCDKKFRNLKNAFKRVHYDQDRSESSKYQWELYKDLVDVFVTNKPETIFRRTKPFEPPAVETEQYNESVEVLSYVEEHDVPDQEMAYKEDREQLESEQDSNKTVDLIMVNEEGSAEMEEERLNEADTSVQRSAADENEPPAWFQMFLVKYDSNTQQMHEKLNRIVQQQELQGSMMEHLTNRIIKLEKKINDRLK